MTPRACSRSLALASDMFSTPTWGANRQHQRASSGHKLATYEPIQQLMHEGL